MNSARLYRLFFFLALGVAICWSLVEFLLMKSETAPRVAGSCQLDVGSTFEIAERSLLNKTRGRMWVYDPAKEVIEERSMGWVSGKPSTDVVSTTPLRCKNPGYQCFVTDQNVGFKKLEPFFFEQGFGLVKAEKGERTSVFPFMISGNQMGLTAPIKMCNKIPPTTGKFNFAQNKLFYFNSAEGVLGVWNLDRFEGIVSQTAAREPDYLYRVTAKDGLVLSTCSEKNIRSVPGEIAISQDRLFLLHDEGTQTRLRSFILSLDGIRPDPSWNLEIQDAERIWGVGPRGLMKVTEDGTVSRIWFSNIEMQFYELKYSGKYTQPLKYFAFSEGGEIFLNTSGYVLSRQKVTRLRENSLSEFKSFGFHFYNNEEQPFYVFQDVEQRGQLVYSAGDDTRVIAFSCQ